MPWCQMRGGWHHRVQRYSFHGTSNRREVVSVLIVLIGFDKPALLFLIIMSDRDEPAGKGAFTGYNCYACEEPIRCGHLRYYQGQPVDDKCDCGLRSFERQLKTKEAKDQLDRDRQVTVDNRVEKEVAARMADIRARHQQSQSQ